MHKKGFVIRMVGLQGIVYFELLPPNKSIDSEVYSQ